MFDKNYDAHADKHIMDLYHFTGTDGKLCVPGFEAGSDEMMTCRMTWTETEAAISIYAFNNIYKKIKTAAENGGEIDFDKLMISPDGIFLREMHSIVREFSDMIKNQADQETIEKQKTILARAYVLNQFAEK